MGALLQAIDPYFGLDVLVWRHSPTRVRAQFGRATRAEVTDVLEFVLTAETTPVNVSVALISHRPNDSNLFVLVVIPCIEGVKRPKINTEGFLKKGANFNVEDNHLLERVGDF